MIIVFEMKNSSINITSLRAGRSLVALSPKIAQFSYAIDC